MRNYLRKSRTQKTLADLPASEQPDHTPYIEFHPGQFRVAVRSARQSGPKLAGKGHQVLPRAAELASAHGAPGYSRPASTMRWRNRRVACSVGSPKMLFGRTGLDDDAALQEADAVGYLTGEAHLVRCDQHCHALVREFADEVEHLRDELRVERGRDLVEEQ